MNCQQAQDQLFAGDALDNGGAAAAHAAGCAACQAVLAGLRRLEAAAHDLPDAADGSAAAKHAFLARLDVTPLPRPAAKPRTTYRPTRLLLLRSAVVRWPRLAVAASVLLCAALGLWMFGSGGTRSVMASEPVVDQLVDWNVKLAAAETPEERGRLLADAAPLRQAVDAGNLPAADQELARKLVDNGQWLAAQNTGPRDDLDEAERFGDVADLLLKRMQEAADAGNVNAVRRYSRNYAMVWQLGMDEKLAKAKLEGTIAPAPGDRPVKLERMLKRKTEMRMRLERLLEQSPGMPQKEIRETIKGQMQAEHARQLERQAEIRERKLQMKDAKDGRRAVGGPAGGTAE